MPFGALACLCLFAGNEKRRLLFLPPFSPPSLRCVMEGRGKRGFWTLRVTPFLILCYRYYGGQACHESWWSIFSPLLRRVLLPLFSISGLLLCTFPDKNSKENGKQVLGFTAEVTHLEAIVHRPKSKHVSIFTLCFLISPPFTRRRAVAVVYFPFPFFYRR